MTIINKKRLQSMLNSTLAPMALMRHLSLITFNPFGKFLCYPYTLCHLSFN